MERAVIEASLAKLPFRGTATVEPRRIDEEPPNFRRRNPTSLATPPTTRFAASDQRGYRG
jgi:hypothetical protein